MGDPNRVEIERVCGLCETCRRVRRSRRAIPGPALPPRINCGRLLTIKSQVVRGMRISVEDCDIYEEREQ